MEPIPHTNMVRIIGFVRKNLTALIYVKKIDIPTQYDDYCGANGLKELIIAPYNNEKGFSLETFCI